MGVIAAKVKKNRKVGEGIYRLALHAPAIAQTARPGQFVMLRVTPGNDPLLARPFSIHGANGDELLILYKVVGRGTGILSQVREGQTLYLWGPLGRGYDLGGERPMLVAGGMGRASLDFAHKELLKTHSYVPYLVAENDQNLVRNVVEGVSAESRQTKVILDIDQDLRLKTEAGDFDPEKVNSLTGTTICFPTSITGGWGGKGFASDYLYSVMTKLPGIAKSILVCGPMLMLKAVALVCVELNLPCQVSLEAPMACGLGACLGCAVPAAGGGYLRACQEGPVLAAEAVDWERV